MDAEVILHESLLRIVWRWKPTLRTEPDAHALLLFRGVFEGFLLYAGKGECWDADTVTNECCLSSVK